MRWSPATSRILAAISRITASFERAVWPLSCVFCAVGQQGKVPVCDDCLDDLPWVSGVQPGLSPLTAIITPLEYAFPIDAAIKAMKFKRRLFYAPAFAHLLMERLADFPDDVDALLPMPLHWRRHALRGFNQAAEIVRPIRKVTGLPVVPNVSRTRNTPYQSGLSAAQRKRNLEAAFTTRGNVSHKHVLIVDDVITTGETCRQLARVLLAAGVQRVSALAIARVLPD